MNFKIFKIIKFKLNLDQINNEINKKNTILLINNLFLGLIIEIIFLLIEEM